MTTVVFRDGIMASDSSSSRGNGRLSLNSLKMARLSSGVLLGWAGSGLNGGREVREPFEQVKVYEDFPRRSVLTALETDCLLLIALPNGSLWECAIDPPDGKMGWSASIYTVHEFSAIGTGAEYAIGAMTIGASAEQAVAAAIKWDTKSGGEIKTLNLKE